VSFSLATVRETGQPANRFSFHTFWPLLTGKFRVDMGDFFVSSNVQIYSSFST
jgi:hypothetical protein